MKTKLYSIAALVILVACAGCGNPFFPAAYKVGDTGPADGIIFYDKGRFTDGWRYLEAAPSGWDDGSPDDPDCQWDTSGTSVNIPGTETALGTGKKNTALILMGDLYAPAAQVCFDFRGGGKSDWFLPSRDELNELYKQRYVVGGLSGTSYWSSSQYNANESEAWNQDFSNGGQYPTPKIGNLYVRPIRSF